ncbi:MAG: DUF2306 domain-containing protein [Pseudomonadota bacterium]
MPSTAPLTDLPPAIGVHLIAALLAIGLGPVAIYRRRRDLWHKSVGYIWVMSMTLTAISAFWIAADVLPLVAAFGPIHLLSVWVLYQLARALSEARGGHIARHSVRMHGLYWTGLMGAGLLTLLPGRTLNRAIFPQMPELAYGVIAGGMVLWVLVIWRQRRVCRSTRNT